MVVTGAFKEVVEQALAWLIQKNYWNSILGTIKIIMNCKTRSHDLSVIFFSKSDDLISWKNRNVAPLRSPYKILTSLFRTCMK